MPTPFDLVERPTISSNSNCVAMPKVRSSAGMFDQTAPSSETCRSCSLSSTTFLVLSGLRAVPFWTFVHSVSFYTDLRAFFMEGRIGTDLITSFSSSCPDSNRKRFKNNGHVEGLISVFRGSLRCRLSTAQSGIGES